MKFLKKKTESHFILEKSKNLQSYNCNNHKKKKEKKKQTFTVKTKVQSEGIEAGTSISRSDR